jgi:CHAD domain-containing protein
VQPLNDRAESMPHRLFNVFQEIRIRTESSLSLAGKSCTASEMRQLRINIKKIRALGAMLNVLYPAINYKKIAREYRRVFKVAGKMRDSQLQMERVAEGMRENGWELSEFYNHLAACNLQYRQAIFQRIKECRRVLKNFPYGSLINAFYNDTEEAIQERMIPYCDELIEQLVLAIHDRIGSVDKDKIDPQDLHPIRIRSKTVEHTISIIQAGLSFPYCEDLKTSLKQINKALGVWHDFEASENNLQYFQSQIAEKPFFDENSYVSFAAYLAAKKEFYYNEFYSMSLKLLNDFYGEYFILKSPP